MKRHLLAVCAVVSLFPTSVIGGPASAAEAGASRKPLQRAITWLSAGDSYSSGEGISGTGQGADHCARSALAYGPVAAAYLRDQRQWDIKDDLVACTGAVSADMAQPPPHPNGVNDLPQETQAANAGHAKSDVVTLSMGGNDIGFADVITGCLLITPSASAGLTWNSVLGIGANVTITGHGVSVSPSVGANGVRASVNIKPDGCAVSSGELASRVADLTGIGGHKVTREMPNEKGVEPKRTEPPLKTWFRNVLDDDVTADGTLVVVGYPQLFAPIGEWPDWRGRTCETVTKRDADMLNAATVDLDEKMREAVKEADGGEGRIEYVSRLDIFNHDGASRSLCGRPTLTWMNGLTNDGGRQVIRDSGGLVPTPLPHSFHPNQFGHAATAKAVASTVAAGLGERLAVPTPTSPPQTNSPATDPPITDPPITSAPSFEIGDAFSDTCTVAWPSAPLRTSNSIQLTMSCPHAPRQFLFVVVAYADPNLDITPSHPTAQVRGTVVDFAESEMGYKMLVVEASSVAVLR